MKSGLGAQCDDFCVSSRLSLKLNLTLERETVLHFFDRIRREHPTLRRLRRRSDGSFVLEELEADPREDGPRRWIRLEPTSLRLGHFNPPAASAWRQFGSTLFEYAPYFLSLSDLDVDHLEVVYGFDFEYRGNHDQLVAETLLADHPPRFGIQRRPAGVDYRLPTLHRHRPDTRLQHAGLPGHQEPHQHI